MIAKYQNSTRQRRHILKSQSVSMVMSDGQDPNVFINEFYLRDELVEMCEVINDDSLLDIVLEGLDDFLQIKYNAEAVDSFTLDKAIYTMRNMHANRIAKHGPSRNQKGRESAMVTTFNTKGKCHVCNKTGHWARDCYHCKSSMKGANKASKKWCNLHKTHLHDNSECRSQQQQLNGNNGNNRNNRNGQRNGQHQAATTTTAHANTAINSGSTTVVENYNNTAASIQGTTTATSTTSTETPASNLHATPPQGIGYSFIAASSTTSNVNFTMTVDSGASSHFIDNRLLPGIEQRMLNYVHLEPLVIINVAGGHRLLAVGKWILIVAEDQQGIQQPVQLPVTIASRLGRHLFSGGTAATNGVSMVIAAHHI